jgi:hypothetical protein
MDSSSLPYATADKAQPVRLRMGDGLAAEEPITIIQQFDKVVAKFGDKPALHQKVLKEVSTFSPLDSFNSIPFFKATEYTHFFAHH